MEQEKKGIDLVCTNNKCEYTWKYKGSSEFYATCPRCKTSVKIPKIYLI